MIVRLAVMVVLIALGVAAYHALIQRQIRRTAALALTDPLLSGVKPGVPTILYFTTPTCIPCKTQQQPTLTRLQNELGERLQVVKVDATEHPDAAQRWGVFSAPTTFVLDGQGATLAVNHGVAEANTLRQQLHITT